MTLDQQIALAQNTQRMCRSANTPDAEDWTHVITTLQKHKRAQEIMTELEQDFREMAELSFKAKLFKASMIAGAKWSKFLEMGRIFLNI